MTARAEHHALGAECDIRNSVVVGVRSSATSMRSDAAAAGVPARAIICTLLRINRLASC